MGTGISINSDGHIITATRNSFNCSSNAIRADQVASVVLTIKDNPLIYSTSQSPLDIRCSGCNINITNNMFLSAADGTFKGGCVVISHAASDQANNLVYLGNNTINTTGIAFVLDGTLGTFNIRNNYIAAGQVLSVSGSSGNLEVANVTITSGVGVVVYGSNMNATFTGLNFNGVTQCFTIAQNSSGHYRVSDSSFMGCIGSALNNSLAAGVLEVVNSYFSSATGPVLHSSKALEGFELIFRNNNVSDVAQVVSSHDAILAITLDSNSFNGVANIADLQNSTGGITLTNNSIAVTPSLTSTNVCLQISSGTVQITVSGNNFSGYTTAAQLYVPLSSSNVQSLFFHLLFLFLLYFKHFLISKFLILLLQFE